jgi:hypothetical protein
MMGFEASTKGSIPAAIGIDPIWWLIGGLLSLLIGFTIGYVMLGVIV